MKLRRGMPSRRRLRSAPGRSAPPALLWPAVIGLIAAAAPAAAGSAPPAPTPAEIANLSYGGIEGFAGPVRLTNGHYEGKPFVAGGAARPTLDLAPGFRLVGDADGDRRDEAVAILAQSSGGSGTFQHLAVVGRRSGKAVCLATAPVGDRVQVRDARIEDGRIVLEVLQAGPGDAMCCPGELATRAWKLAGGALREIPTGAPAQRLTLAAVGDTDWVLRAWDWNELLRPGIEVTLRFDGERLVGYSGCNSYFTAVQPGKAPGEITLGPVVATRKACPEAEMAVEAHFLKVLEGVERFSFMAGRLALTYREGDTLGVMLFDRPARP